MSTVTLSKPHCAITSAEKPDGIASHALTTALPDAQISFTLFAIGRVSLVCLFLHRVLPSFPVCVQGRQTRIRRLRSPVIPGWSGGPDPESGKTCDDAGFRVRACA